MVRVTTTAPLLPCEQRCFNRRQKAASVSFGLRAESGGGV